MPNDLEKPSKASPKSSKKTASTDETKAAKTRSVSDIRKAAAERPFKKRAFGTFDSRPNRNNSPFLELMHHQKNFLGGFSQQLASLNKNLSAFSGISTMARDIVDSPFQELVRNQKQLLGGLTQQIVDLNKSLSAFSDADKMSSYSADLFSLPSSILHLSSQRGNVLAISGAYALTANNFTSATTNSLQEPIWDQIITASAQLESNDEAAASTLLVAINGILELLQSIAPNTQKRGFVRFFIDIMFPLLLLMYSQVTSNMQFDELDSRLDKIETNLDETHSAYRMEHSAIADALSELADAINQAAEQTAQYQYYVVERMTPLTPSRHYSDRRLMTLMPGQEVELLERAGKWIRVEAYDPVTQKTTQGWVLKKYLKRVE